MPRGGGTLAWARGPRGLSRRSSGRVVGVCCCGLPAVPGFDVLRSLCFILAVKGFQHNKKAIFRRALRPCSMTLVRKVVYAMKMCICTVADPCDNQKPSLNWLVSVPIKRGLLSGFLHLIRFCLYKNINI